MCLELAAGHASQHWLVVPGHPGGPHPSPPGPGAPKPFSKLLVGEFTPTPLPGGCGEPSLALWSCLVFRHHLWGWSQHVGGAGWGKSLPQPLAGESSPRLGEPPPCPPSAVGGH